jgi:hypothetical protein
MEMNFVYRRPIWARCIAHRRNFDRCDELSLAMKFSASRSNWRYLTMRALSGDLARCVSIGRD